MSCVQKDVSCFRFCGGMGLFDQEESQNENALFILLYEAFSRTAFEEGQKENGEGILEGRKRGDP